MLLYQPALLWDGVFLRAQRQGCSAPAGTGSAAAPPAALVGPDSLLQLLWHFQFVSLRAIPMNFLEILLAGEAIAASFGLVAPFLQMPCSALCALLFGGAQSATVLARSLDGVHDLSSGSLRLARSIFRCATSRLRGVGKNGRALWTFKRCCHLSQWFRAHSCSHLSTGWPGGR